MLNPNRQLYGAHTTAAKATSVEILIVMTIVGTGIITDAFAVRNIWKENHAISGARDATE
jgi:hypothetical protein